MARLIRGLSLPKKDVLLLVTGGIILAFGLYNIHSISPVTEGGVLGASLLLDSLFSISPALSGLVMNVLCYGLGTKVLGKRFVVYSLISAGVYSSAYALFACFPPVYPEIGSHPLAAALAGAVFVGVGAGLGVRAGGAAGGDDAFAMAMSALTGVSVRWWYLISDLVVLGLSLTYIPVKEIAYSLLTVVLSGQLVGFIEKKGRGGKAPSPDSSGRG